MSVCDPLYSSRSLILRFNGASGSTVFTDESSYGHSVTPHGGAQIDTSRSLHGGASGYFNGTDAYLTVVRDSALTLSDGDFIVEFDLWLDTLGNQNLFDYRAAVGTNGILIALVSGLLSFRFGNSTTTWQVQIDAASSPSLSAWHHVEATRSGTTFRLFVDGALIGTQTVSPTAPSDPTTIFIGARIDGANRLSGNLENLRITKEVSGNTAAYTPTASDFAVTACVSNTIDCPASLSLSSGNSTVDCAAELTLVHPSNTIDCPASIEILPGYSTIDCVSALRIVTENSTIDGASSLTVARPAYTIACAAALRLVSPAATLDCAAALVLVDPVAPPSWTAYCEVGGVDVSAYLVQSASVRFEEGAARIATVTLAPPSGPIAPLDYVGKPIRLDYVPVFGVVRAPMPLFRGRVDTPEYDPASARLTLRCTDDLQNRVAALDRAAIDVLVGGRYSEAVQGKIDDNWQYAQARLTTVAGSLDISASGGMRVTPWQLAMVNRIYGASALLYARSSVSYPQRSTMVNDVSIEFDYRYARLRARYTSIGWSGTQAEMAACGFEYPTQGDILGAAGGSGWQVVRGTFYPAPAAIPFGGEGGYVYPRPGSIDMAVVNLMQRHSQSVTEQYRISVTAPESVAINGRLPGNVRGALQSAFDGGAWETSLDAYPVLPNGGETDYAPDAPRGMADDALQTLLDQAWVKILGSHRAARVKNAVLCDPSLDLTLRVAIAHAGLTAEGKVVAGEHVLDFDRGSAVTEFELASFGAGGAGILTPDVLTPPGPPAPANGTQDWSADVANLQVCVAGITPYSERIMGLLINTPQTITAENVPGKGSVSYINPHYSPQVYPVSGFRVGMPGVAEPDRAPIEKTIEQEYRRVLPLDPLEFTVP